MIKTSDIKSKQKINEPQLEEKGWNRLTFEVNTDDYRLQNSHQHSQTSKKLATLLNKQIARNLFWKKNGVKFGNETPIMNLETYTFDLNTHQNRKTKKKRSLSFRRKTRYHLTFEVNEDKINSILHTYPFMVFSLFHQCPVLKTRTSASRHLAELQSIWSNLSVVLMSNGELGGGRLWSTRKGAL